MRYVLVTPPATRVVSLSEAKAHLRVDSSDEDAPIGIYLDAAVAHLDGRAGLLGRAMVNQTWRLDTYGPVASRIPIDMPNVSSVSSVKYLTGGLEATWSSAEYRLGSDGQKFFIEPKDGYSWPAADDQEDAFRVAFIAGYGDATAVPPALKAAILLIAGDLYEHRETVAVGAAAASIPTSATVDRLINPYRVRSL